MRRTKLNILVLTSALALSFLGTQAIAVPRPENRRQNERTTRKEMQRNASVYRVNYKVDEIENGKIINSRSYTMMVKSGSEAKLRIESRVPYNMAKSAIQYKEIGTKIDCAISKHEGSLVIRTKLQMISLIGKGPKPLLESMPVFGELQIENVTVAAMGKPALVGSAAAVASKRRYVVEVTVANKR